MTSEEKEELYSQFNKEFPISRLKDLKLEEYTGTSEPNSNGRKDFTYWVEHRTDQLGGIFVRSSSAFGIYKNRNTFENKELHLEKTDGTYTWVSKLGNTASEAWEKVRSFIIEIAEHASKGDFGIIDDLGSGVFTDQFKWKTAFLYSGNTKKSP